MQFGFLLLVKVQSAVVVKIQSAHTALGVFGAARELGRTPGVDLSIGGFNNLAITEHLTIPLTTVNSPRSDMGQRAMRMLIDIIEGRSAGEQVVLPTQLVVRASTCPAHSAL